MESYVVSGLKEAVTLATNNKDWTSVRTLLEVTIAEHSVEYTQLQQIDVSCNLIEEACTSGFTQLMSIFLNSGFPVNYVVNKQKDRRILHLAAIHNHLSLVKLLLNAGADIDCKMSDGSTPLFLAVQKGYLEIAEFLITAGADINTCDKNGKSLLDASLYYNAATEEMLQLLLESGCDPITSHSYCPLYWAVRSNNIKNVKMLLDAGANVNGSVTRRPLHSAAWNGNIFAMQLLLDYGADINARRRDGGTALHRAVVNSKLQSVKFLIEHGSLINSIDICNQSPLYVSIKYRHFDISMLLVNSGADLDLNIHRSLLHRAVYCGAPIQLIEFLLEHGANVTTVCRNETAVESVIGYCRYETALESVIWYSNYSNDEKLKIAKLLLIYGSNAYVRGYFGNTLLHWACRMGDVELVEYLIEYGLNVDAKNIEGKKPYDIATKKGHTNIVKAIIRYHCNKYMRF